MRERYGCLSRRNAASSPPLRTTRDKGFARSGEHLLFRCAAAADDFTSSTAKIPLVLRVSQSPFRL